MTTRREQKHNEVRRKIRESCNTCSSQKIRCGKQRPICSRCAARGIECNYSYSQRTGRRAAMRPLSTETISAAASPGRDNDHSRQSMTPSLTPPATGIVVDGTGTFSFEDLENTTTNEFQASDEQAEDTDANTCSDLFWLARGAAPTSCNNFGSDTRLVPTEEGIGPLDLLVDGNADWHPLQSSASEADLECSTKPLAPEPIQDSTTPPVRFAVGRHRRQDCMTLALHVVDSLHVSHDRCKSSDPMAWMQAPKESPRDVDAVLLQNRDAIKTVNRILDCPCSADQSVGLACYLATAKIIHWYATAMGISMDGFEAEDNSNASASTSTNAGQSLLGDEIRPKSVSDRIVSRPILMGRYCLDADIQRSVLAKVILSELKEHIQPLMNCLPRYDISHSDNYKISEQGPSRLSSLSGTKIVSRTLPSQLKRIMSAAGNIANNS